MAVRNTSGTEEVPKLPRPSWREKEDGLTEPYDALPLDEPGISIFLDAATDPRLRPRSKHKTRNLDRRMLVVSGDIVRHDFESPVALRGRERLQSILHQVGAHSSHGHHEVFPPDAGRAGRGPKVFLLQTSSKRITTRPS